MTVVGENRFEDLVSELSSRAKLDRNSLLKLIEQKKAKVGAGYLTDQGALFLVATDLGVSVEYDRERPSSLSRIEADLHSVTVLGRFLSLGIPRSFTRRGDSTKGLLSKLVIYDSTGTAVVSLWDSASLKMLDSGLRPGDILKISDAYTRPGLDGHPELNVGEKGRFEKIDESDDLTNRMERLEKLIVSPSVVSEGGRFLVVRGKIDGGVKRSSFPRSNGSNSNLVSFSIVDELETKSPTRVVIWNNPASVFEKIQSTEVITLLNVRTKISTFQNSSALEIHGDETTSILERFEEIRAWMLERTKENSLSRSSTISAEEKAPPPARPVPFVGRVLSRRFSPNDRRYHFLIMDSQKRKIVLTLSDEAAKNLSEDVIPQDSVVICRPDSIDQTGLRAVCNAPNSLAKVGAKRQDIPLSSSLFVKVEDIPSAEGAIISLESMCLSAQPSREIQTKDGLVKRAEITVADHTGEVKVFGWRNLSKLLEDFSAGDRVVLEAVETQIFEGKKFLVLKNYSKVEKKPLSG